MPSTTVPAWDYGAVAPARRGSVARAVGAWFADSLLGERGRWPLWLPVFMGVGIGAYFWLPPYWIAPAGLALGVAGWAAAWRRFARWLMPAAALTVAFVGFGLAQWQTWPVAAPVIEHRLGPVEVMGRLVSVDPLPEGTRIASSRPERSSV